MGGGGAGGPHLVQPAFLRAGVVRWPQDGHGRGQCSARRLEAGGRADAKLPPYETVGADVKADIERIEDNHRLKPLVQIRMLEPLEEELDAEQRCDAAMRKAVWGDKYDELRRLQNEAHRERWEAFDAWRDAQWELKTRERMISSAANRRREGWAPPSPCRSNDAHTCWLVGCDQCSMCYHFAPGEA